MLEYQRLKEVNDLPLAVKSWNSKDGVGRANEFGFLLLRSMVHFRL